MTVIFGGIVHRPPVLPNYIPSQDAYIRYLYDKHIWETEQQIRKVAFKLTWKWMTE